MKKSLIKNLGKYAEKGFISPNRLDLIGRRFGRLVVTSFNSVRNKGRFTYWNVICDCGKQKIISGQSLKNNVSQSCGCLRKEVAAKQMFKHGLSKIGNIAPNYILWNKAKERAKVKHLEFSILPEDIIIPTICPLLNIPLIKGIKTMHNNSPTLDRIDTTKGYTKDNIWVISWRANRLKSDSSLNELRLIVSNLQKKINKELI